MLQVRNKHLNLFFHQTLNRTDEKLKGFSSYFKHSAEQCVSCLFFLRLMESLKL